MIKPRKPEKAPRKSGKPRAVKRQTIKLNRDAYGVNARASAIADFLELACLAGVTLSEEDLRDRLRDSGTKLPPEKYVLFAAPGDDIGDDDDDDDASTDAYADSARRVFELVKERSRILGARYPFKISLNKLKLNTTQHGEPYLSLLAMAVAHAHVLTIPGDPKRLFEETVARILRSRGWKAANLGKASKAQKGQPFAKALKAVSRECDLVLGTGTALVSSAANDEGVDTIAHDSWEDSRVGRWILIGQATFEKSDGWHRKVREPSPILYSKLFKEDVAPQPFLAVPYHVEPKHLEKLVQDSGKVVLDRLRLARFDPGVSAEERAILMSVRSCAVEYR